MNKRIDPQRVRDTLIYNPETGRFVWRKRPVTRPEDRRWNTRYAGKEAFTTTTPKGYCKSKIDAVAIGAHNAAWAYVHGQWPEVILDHINGDPADNRVKNLRLSDYLENARNQRAYRKRSGLPPGVNRNYRKFGARVSVGGVSHYLGSFVTPEEAHAAYLDGLRRLGFSPRHGR